jgi:hypothetical protein
MFHSSDRTGTVNPGEGNGAREDIVAAVLGAPRTAIDIEQDHE